MDAPGERGTQNVQVAPEADFVHEQARNQFHDQQPSPVECIDNRPGYSGYIPGFLKELTRIFLLITFVQVDSAPWRMTCASTSILNLLA